ncbi:MAG: hypothetical protein ACRD3C_11875 [Vicinamibacterales bacterium]
MQAIFWVMILASVAGTSWGQMFVFKRGEATPSRLKTVLGPVSQTVEKHKSSIGCYDGHTGLPNNCTFVMNINGLATFGFLPEELDGGHSHTGGRPLGQLRFGGTTGNQVSGQTGNTQVVVEHLLPQVGEVIERRLDLFVPPGWRTVDPQACDATQSYWCFLHHLNIKVEQELLARSGSSCAPLPPAGTTICKLRNPDENHKDTVAFYGTFSTQVLLSEVGNEFQRTDEQGRALAVNDMSLISGGYFDLKLNWAGELDHSTHRTGTSADINKDLLGITDCTKPNDLRAAVDSLMPVDPRSPIATRTNPAGASRFLCESGNRIHIDFDQSQIRFIALP